MNHRVVLNHAEDFKEPLGFCGRVMGTSSWDFLKCGGQGQPGRKRSCFFSFLPSVVVHDWLSHLRFPSYNRAET